MSGKTVPLTLLVRAVDRSSGPLDRLTARLERMNAPFARIGKSFSRLGKRFGALAEESGLNKMGAAFKGVGSALGKVGSEVFSLGKKMLAMGVVAGAVLFAFVKSSVDAGDVLAKTSDRLGVTIDYFSQLNFVAGRAGISTEEMTTAFDFFNKLAGKASMGTGKLVEVLKHTPLAFQKSFKGAKTTEEKLDLMFVAMAKIPDAGKRAAFAAEVFGRGVGPKMSAMVQNGVGEIAELRAEFVRMNGSQEKFARSAEVLNDAMGDVETAFGGVKVAVMTELFPAFIDLAGVLKEFLIENREGIGLWAKQTAKAITDWVREGGIKRLTETFQRLFEKVSPIIDRLGGWPTVLGGIAAVIVSGPLLGALAGLGASFLTLGAAMLTTPVGWFLGAFAAIAAIAALVIMNWEPVKGFFAEWFPNLSKSITDIWQGLSLLVDWFGKAAAAEKAWEMRKQLELDASHNKPDSELSLWERGLKWASRNDTAGRAQRAGLGAGGARLNAGAARPSFGAGTAAASKAQVQIDIAGLPKGSRVTPAADNDADLDLTVGPNLSN